MNDQQDLEKRTIRIKRVFDAPRDLVWEAWTQPEHITHWYGPGDLKTEIVKHDFTEGGEWEYTMVMPDGQLFRSFGVFSRIVEPELVETSANFIPMTEGVTLQAFFKEAGDKTEFIFSVIHPTEEYCKQQKDMGIYNGWGSVFENLNQYLVSMSMKK